MVDDDDAKRTRMTLTVAFAAVVAGADVDSVDDDDDDDATDDVIEEKRERATADSAGRTRSRA